MSDLDWLREEDRTQIAESGIPLDEIARQLEIFSNGVAPVRLDRAALIDDGIEKIDNEQYDKYKLAYQTAQNSGRISKFVPASGAASRMFKSLSKIYNEKETFNRSEMEERAQFGDKDAAFLLEFIDNLNKFAFYPYLYKILKDNYISLEQLQDYFYYKIILQFTLTNSGLDLVKMPKGLIPFHNYRTGNRTAFEDQLCEAIFLCRNRDDHVRIHFTVPPDHEQTIKAHLERFARIAFPEISFDITLSIQKPKTDTIAVDMDNQPFRLEDGTILFRPGGHGALLENLAEIEGDIVIIKNIDNIVPTYKNEESILNRQLLGGYLILTQRRTHDYLKVLTSEDPSSEKLDEIKEFAKDCLNVEPTAEWNSMDSSQKRDYLVKQMNRPIRVCGMVKNEGEPGGGPFWVKAQDGEVSLQIVETSQIDLDDDEQKQIFRSSTHFNPVDLICGMKDFEGKTFDLTEYTDPDTGFISYKSKDGRDLKAYEHPGLWNGAMAEWITIFVEIPLSTFNPVKTVNDLLRPAHQR